jgi:hypothetical protein
VWYLAADIQAPGLDGTENIAVWGVRSLTEPGWIGSAEALSRHYTGLDDLEGRLTIDHEEARDARRCTRRLQLLTATPSPESDRERERDR